MKGTRRAMKQGIAFLVAAFFSLAAFPGYGATASSPQPPKPAMKYMPDEILVKFKPGIRLDANEYYKTQHRVKTIGSFSIIGVDHLKLPESLTVEDAITLFKKNPGVEYSEPNYYWDITSIPNDPNFALLWGLHNTGQSVNGTSGKADADIDAPEAWDLNIGSGNVIVAVIDSGVYVQHPDLAANIWVNPGEIPGNGIDDDLNGLIDDINGWDFFDNEKDPNDLNGHGTHVAGTIGAVGNHNNGVAGVSWGAKIMALNFTAADGSGSTSDAIKCIEYANAKGAHVINNSWGGGSYSQALKDAIDASPAVVVCASGNDGFNNDVISHYPSNYSSSNLIAVAATDQNDNPAYFSNYGFALVDVAAPGVNILSIFNNGGYGYKNGTSMAAPHVSGLAALLWGRSWPSNAENRILTASDIVQRIIQTVDPLPSLSGKTASGGRINAFKALGGSDENGEDGNGGCFIATAAFGSITEPHVATLRQFRDRFMKTNAFGRAVTHLYSRHSTKWAAIIRDHDSLRWIARTALLPVVGLSRMVLFLGAWLAIPAGMIPLLSALFFVDR